MTSGNSSTLSCTLTGIALFFGVCGVAMAATDAEKRTAIDDGLAYLASTQQADGRWEYGDDFYDTAATAAALLAFLEERDNWTADYSSNVTQGFDYLLGKAQPYDISVQPAGDPDSDGNGIGVKFVLGSDNGRDTYVTGLVVPAFARSGTPNATVSTGLLAARTDGTGPGGAWTYRDVVVNANDYFAYGQNEIGSSRGGWRYFANSTSSDNSTAQWPAIAALFSSTVGVSAPAFVKDELAYWIEYIQNDNGCSGYDSPNSAIAPNEAKTGGLLVEMVLAEDDTLGNAYDLSNADLLNALSCLNDRWQNTANGTWDGNFGHPYAMWSVYKGLELTIGLDDTAYITNLRDQSTARGGSPAPLDSGDVWTWWEDYCESLVDSQNADGSWSGYSNWTGPLATAWHINILAATRIDDEEEPPTPVEPIPAISAWGLVLLSLLLPGVAVFRRIRP